MKNKLHKLIESIGLALNSCHHTVTTDDINAKPEKDYSWTIDNSKELALLLAA